ncbi:hypothetical protein TgHK011_006508 [Trichoderma gracile]|nr:hypothetical protein TgHK011_006508 [Trichoderma gracile]
MQYGLIKGRQCIDQVRSDRDKRRRCRFIRPFLESIDCCGSFPGKLTVRRASLDVTRKPGTFWPASSASNLFFFFFFFPSFLLPPLPSLPPPSCDSWICFSITLLLIPNIQSFPDESEAESKEYDSTLVSSLQAAAYSICTVGSSGVQFSCIQRPRVDPRRLS